MKDGKTNAEKNAGKNGKRNAGTNAGKMTDQEFDEFIRSKAQEEQREEIVRPSFCKKLHDLVKSLAGGSSAPEGSSNAPEGSPNAPEGSPNAPEGSPNAPKNPSDDS